MNIRAPYALHRGWTADQASLSSAMITFRLSVRRQSLSTLDRADLPLLLMAGCNFMEKTISIRNTEITFSVRGQCPSSHAG